MCISSYCYVVFTHLYLISWWVPPPLYFPFQVDSRARTKSRKQSHLEGEIWKAIMPVFPEGLPDGLRLRQSTTKAALNQCWHVRHCITPRLALAPVDFYSWRDQNGQMSGKQQQNKSKERSQERYYKRKNPGTVVLPYQSCQDNACRWAEAPELITMHILQPNDRFQTLALSSALKYTSRKAAGGEVNFQYNVKQFLIIQNEKHKHEITGITQQYSNKPISDAGFLLLHV